jgi:hypothetical protein
MICHGTSPHAVTGFGGTVQWICTSCEYRAEFPNRPMIPAAPGARRALPLQTEVLFTV